ncbi:MAG: metal-dependent transcriptional regulator [Chloroflexi bacterium]|nr:metal-dependent transcriptional regulator [Chloroflexota bacterium]
MSPDFDRPTATVEDYLQEIYNLLEEGKPVIGARLAERVRVSAPTASATLQRMQRDGLVVADDHKDIHLTDKGREAAESIKRRHFLAERLLVDILGLDWAAAHEEAHRIEHAVSPRVEERISAVLGNPTTCPHGNPFPGVPHPATVLLASLSEGDEREIDGVQEEAEEDAELMLFLQQNGMTPGATLRVVEVATYNATMTIEIDGKNIVLGVPAAENLRVLDPTGATAS